MRLRKAPFCGKDDAMDIQIIQVPYDSGHFDLRMGLGPAHFLQHGLAKQLQDAGHQISETRLHCAADPMNPVATTFSINRLLAKHVRLALQHHSLPLVLAGNCNSCIGSIAGAGEERLGVIWFDAHADFNTPDTTLSGYIDGMGLAMATGRGWKNLMVEIPGFKPVPDKRVILVGARDLDHEEDQGACGPPRRPWPSAGPRRRAPRRRAPRGAGG